MGRVRRPEHSTLADSAREQSYSTRASLPPVETTEPPKGTLARFLRSEDAFLADGDSCPKHVSSGVTKLLR